MQSETMRLMPRLLLKQRIGRSKKLIAQRVRYVAFWVRRFLPKSRLADRPVLLWRELNSLPVDLSKATCQLRIRARVLIRAIDILETQNYALRIYEVALPVVSPGTRDNGFKTLCRPSFWAEMKCRSIRETARLPCHALLRCWVYFALLSGVRFVFEGISLSQDLIS